MLGSVVLGRLEGSGVVVTGLGTKTGEMEEGEDVERGKAADTVKMLRERVGVGRTVVALGKGVGTWIRERNALLTDLDVEKEGVMVCEGGVCRQGHDFL